MSAETINRLTGTGPGSLSQILDFDHVVRISAAGDVSDDAPSDVRAPECHEPSAGQLGADDGWTLITEGLTGQYGYKGPWLHDSEQIEGGVAERILWHAAEHGGGFYVAVYATWDCQECGGAGQKWNDDMTDEVPCPANCEPGDTTIEGWAIAYKVDESMPLDVWLRIPDADADDADPIAEAEANTFRDGDAFRVDWYLNAVGLVKSRMFRTHEAAREWLTAEGFSDFSS